MFHASLVSWALRLNAGAYETDRPEQPARALYVSSLFLLREPGMLALGMTFKILAEAITPLCPALRKINHVAASSHFWASPV